ncbi:hypothetical protein NGM99_13675 [Mesorhizobium sp. RP14(2022)]|uniref:Uncharacterized protein n=1 Tax=Mesorhizobium liriopis TaxID=2953882 RepID=A0ABT1C8L1_9HYPH|nr:hypothetical protein [Mesorhizobium liriopis]MCO6050828.1 hypothetical protein [Mesorhizobium liriopis]
MQKFVLIDEAGFFAGGFSTEVHGEKMRPIYGPVPEPTEEEPSPVAPIIGEEPNPDCKIPAQAIPVTFEQWYELVNNQGRRRWEDGKITAYEPPEPEPPVPASISDRQFSQALAMQGLITQDEALAAVKTGDVPADMQAYVDQLPAAERFAATMLLSGATSFNRDHPLVDGFGAAKGMTPEQIDDLWRFGATL